MELCSCSSMCRWSYVSGWVRVECVGLWMIVCVCVCVCMCACGVCQCELVLLQLLVCFSLERLPEKELARHH